MTSFQINGEWPLAGATYGPTAPSLYGLPADPPCARPPNFRAKVSVKCKDAGDLRFYDTLPKFAAANLFGFAGGAAPAYGELAFVLKDEVKQYASLIPADSLDGREKDVKKLLQEGIGLYVNLCFSQRFS